MRMLQSFFLFAVCTWLTIVSSSALALQTELMEAFNAGQADLNVRMRYENVNEDSMLKEAKGLTLRTRLGFTTAPIFSSVAHIDINDVRALIDDYAPEKINFSAINDPTDTELNQAYLSMQFNDALNIKVGRQRLMIDNGRFIGDSEWRQNEQTFDALRLNYSVENLLLTMSYIKQVNGVSESLSAKNVDNLIFNVSYQIANETRFIAYHYSLDQTMTEAMKTGTTGLRLTGESGDKIKLIYTLEYAAQKNNLQNSIAEYQFVELGIKFNTIMLLANYEVLGSDKEGYGFQTPLASQHEFNGWSDIWTETPDQGLEDINIKLLTSAWSTNFVAAYHDYRANQNGDDFGSEVNLSAIRKFADRYTLGVKYASFTAGKISQADSDKIWLWAEVSF